jgi:predicted ester cyclase
MSPNPIKTMNKPITELAQQYVDLSNQHGLDQVFPLFEDQATYSSSQFGAFEGIDAIKDMMTGFFTKFPDVHWDVETYTPETDDTVVFDFIMKATDLETGNKVTRQGRERIRFSDTSLIIHIEVEVITT